MKGLCITIRTVAALAVLMMVLTLPASAKTSITLPYVEPGDHRHGHILSLLTLALDRTVAEFGEYELAHFQFPSVRSRSERLVGADNGLDLTWAMTTPEREEKFIPIRIPLQKGLLGHRVFLIRPERADEFARVETLNDLKQFTAGLGREWSDYTIMERNGLPVVPCASYAKCFDMLHEGRFDYFSRGVAEPWDEIRERPVLELAVEKTILLRYQSPIYFFVRRDRPELAARIEKGLRAALQDGSFDHLFYNHPQVNQALKKARLGSRKVIDLQNPNLPPETPLDDTSLWIDLRRVP